MNNSEHILLTCGAMARQLGVRPKWLKAEAEAGRLPHVKAEDIFLFEPETVFSILVERAQQKKNASVGVAV
ncbi:MAG: hypothetical protein MUO27_08250 [Sedimentisphaerales bacterium]|nr:hypothetical protein [Sedimentisphaerales bacterium]